MLLVTATLVGINGPHTRTSVIECDQLPAFVSRCMDHAGYIHSMTVVRLTEEDLKEFNEAEAKE